MGVSAHKDLVRMGEEFRRAREEKGLSFRDIEAATSIRSHCLEAIESGCLGKLISPVYARGFIKKYALFLGIDPELLFKEHPYVVKILDEFSLKESGLLFELGTFESRNSPGREVKWFPGVMKILLSLVVTAAVWWVISYIGG